MSILPAYPLPVPAKDEPDDPYTAPVLLTLSQHPTVAELWPCFAALLLTAGCAPVLARKLGVPQPALPRRAWGVAVAHRQACATLTGLLLLLAGLAPLWQAAPGPAMQRLQATVQPPVEPTGPPVLHSSLGPLPEPTTTAQLFAPAAPAKPWLLRYARWKEGEQPLVSGRDRFATAEACHAELVRRYEPRLKLMAHPGNGHLKPEVHRQPGRYAWASTMPGTARVYEEATCAQEERTP